MKKVLLFIEGCISTPFFLVAWLISSMWFGIVGGVNVAGMKEKEKNETLDTVFPERKKK